MLLGSALKCVVALVKVMSQFGGGCDEEVFDLLDGGGVSFGCAAVGDQYCFRCVGGGVFAYGQTMAG